jgi:hypothetical protein
MKNSLNLIIILLLAPSIIQSEDLKLESRFVSLGLFKNGLAVVRKAVSVPGPGTFFLEDIPEPVHGTFWIEAGPGVEARMTSRLIDVPIQGTLGADFQEELAGREVVINFRDGVIPPVVGNVVEGQSDKSTDDRNRVTLSSRYDSYGSVSQPSVPRRFLVVDGSEGRTYVDASMIAYIRAKGSNGKAKQRKPILLLTVPKVNSKPAEVVFSYLARGISWAPSYRVDISKPDLLSLEQNAVVKNELGNIEESEISLISGFPNIQFAHVISPLSLKTNWMQFFQQLNQRNNPANPITINSARQQAVTSNESSPVGSVDLAAFAGEGVDLYQQSIGKRSLLDGDSMVVSTGSGKAAYERIIEWILPDTRDAYGRYVQDYQRQQDPEKYDDSAWDAIRFKNPLPFPMTTAPVMIVSNEKFNGQQLSYWVNPGEETTLRITKALSLRTLHIEQEEPGQREIITTGADSYRKVSVKGELKISNNRKSVASIVIRRRFSGDLSSADSSPKCVLREEGVYSVNKRNELTWTLNVKPGEEVTLVYRYSLLVHI